MKFLIFENKFIRFIINLIFVVGWFYPTFMLAGLLDHIFFKDYPSYQDINPYLEVAMPNIYGFGVYFGSKYIWSRSFGSNKLSYIFSSISILLGIIVLY